MVWPLNITAIRKTPNVLYMCCSPNTIPPVNLKSLIPASSVCCVDVEDLTPPSQSRDMETLSQFGRRILYQYVDLTFEPLYHPTSSSVLQLSQGGIKYGYKCWMY
ncbi:unnamed protein product [Arctogadus glacialis]